MLVLLLLTGGTLVAWHRTSGSERVPPSSVAASSVATALPVHAPPPALARPTSQSAPAPQTPVAFIASPAPVAMIDEGYPVDLDRLRVEIPGNRYWVDSAPTDDPEVIERREADSAGWNQLHGKVLSGTASDAEIRAWIDHRRQVSEDAIEFAQRVLTEHGSELPERDRGLLELAISMHRTRLAELPRQESDARARKAEQDRRRAAWNGRTTP
ncbi:MAG TPA: hypothetical protein VFD38_20465 [Myxococcaceae bacterium]|nr:hypothetical protein [Myxococcaceae bacterium]